MNSGTYDLQPRARTPKPKTPIFVNRFSPQAKGLTAWFPPIAVGGNTLEGMSIRDIAQNNELRSSSTQSPTIVVDEKFGHAIRMNGTNDVFTAFRSHAGAPEPVSKFITAATGIMMCWVRPIAPFNTSGNVWNLEAIFGDASAFMGVHFGTRTGDTGDRIYFYNWDGNEDFFSVPVVDSQWIHVAWRHAGGVLYGYVNGLPVGSMASGGTSNLTGTFRVGNAGGAFLNCDFFDVRTYNVDVSPEVIYQTWHPSTRWDLYRSFNEVMLVPTVIKLPGILLDSPAFRTFPAAEGKIAVNRFDPATEVTMGASGLDVLYLDNDNIVELDEFRSNEAGGTYLNAATVSVRVYTLAGVAVTSSVNLAYVAGSNGRYQGTIDKTLLPSTGVGAVAPGRYRAVVTAAQTGIEFEQRVISEIRFRDSQ